MFSVVRETGWGKEEEGGGAAFPSLENPQLLSPPTPTAWPGHCIVRTQTWHKDRRGQNASPSMNEVNWGNELSEHLNRISEVFDCQVPYLWDCWTRNNWAEPLYQTIKVLNWESTLFKNPTKQEEKSTPSKWENIETMGSSPSLFACVAEPPQARERMAKARRRIGEVCSSHCCHHKHLQSLSSFLSSPGM